jgi:phage/conjugal plasmid C-4 type zinc finger TraR family protein
MLSSAHFEQAEARVEQERDAAVAGARANLEKAGSIECVECGQTIPERRRLAYPSATRCIDCQTEVEREAYLK